MRVPNDMDGKLAVLMTNGMGGIEVGALWRAEAEGDVAEDDAGPQRALDIVVRKVQPTDG